MISRAALHPPYRAGECDMNGRGGAATEADLAGLEIRRTWRIKIAGLALNAGVIAAVAWMLSGT
ncbi:MAG: hypothetical protein OXF74_05370 [Rhodobacteraceae bacterium]|nr:hypothetical protein [Paracoccaceae bacterium]